MSYNHQSIIKNWKLLAEGEKQGLYACFTLFYDDLYRFGLSLYKDPDLIKDSIQNLFLELWQIRHKLADVDNIQQYIFTIYKRTIYKTHKKQNLTDAGSDVMLDELNDQQLCESPYEAILIASQEDEHLRKRLQHALSSLTPRQKEIIQMRYFDCLSFKEISTKTSLTERTVYNTLHNAVNVLRENMLCVALFF